MSTYNMRKGGVPQGLFGSQYNYNQEEVVPVGTNPLTGGGGSVQVSPAPIVPQANTALVAPAAIASDVVTSVEPVVPGEVPVVDSIGQAPSIRAKIGDVISRGFGDLGINKPTSKLDAIGQALSGIGRNISNSYAAERQAEDKANLDNAKAEQAMARQKQLLEMKQDADLVNTVQKNWFNATKETQEEAAGILNKQTETVDVPAVNPDGTPKMDANGQPVMQKVEQPISLKDRYFKANQVLSKQFAPTAGGSYASTPSGITEKSTASLRNKLIDRGYDPTNVENAINNAPQGKLYNPALLGEIKVVPKVLSPKGWARLNDTQIVSKDTGEVRYAEDANAYPSEGPTSTTSPKVSVPPQYRYHQIDPNTGDIIGTLDVRKDTIPITNPNGEVVNKFVDTSMVAPGLLTGGLKTADQKKAYTLTNTMLEARGNIVDIINDPNFDPSGAYEAAQGILPTVAQSTKVQQYEQAKTTYLEMLSKALTGAAGSAYEAAIHKLMSFPPFGSDPEVMDNYFAQVDNTIKSMAEGTSPEAAVYINNGLKNQGSFRIFSKTKKQKEEAELGTQSNSNNIQNKPITSSKPVKNFNDLKQ